MKAIEILKTVTTILNMTQQDICKVIGVNPSRLSDVSRGKTQKISRKTAEAIVNHFPLLSLSFILTGEGSPYADGRHYDGATSKLTPQQVLEAIFTTYNTNINKLSIATGISSGNLSNLSRGVARPKSISKANADKIRSIYPDICLEFLINGTGPMFTNGSYYQPTIDEAYEPQQPSESQSKYVTREDLIELLRLQDEKNNRKFNQILSILTDERDNGIAAEDIIIHHHEK